MMHCQAARPDALAFLQLLASYGVDIRAANLLQQNALDRAIRTGNLDTLNWLVQARIQASRHKTGSVYPETLLHEALEYSKFDLELLKWILTQGVDVCAIGYLGKTAIDILKEKLQSTQIPARQEKILKALAFLENYIQEQEHKKTSNTWSR